MCSDVLKCLLSGKVLQVKVMERDAAGVYTVLCFVGYAYFVVSVGGRQMPAVSICFFQCLLYNHVADLNTVLYALCYLFAFYLKKLAVSETAWCHS